MPLDTSIPLQLRPAQIDSPLNVMSKAYEVRNAQQANALNEMKMQELQRATAEQEAVRNYFATRDPNSPDFVKGLYGVSPTQGLALEKSRSELSKEKALTGKTEAETSASKFETARKKLDIMGQAFGHVRSSPTPQAAAMALSYLVTNGVIDKAQADEQLAIIAQNPSTENIKALADQAFTAVLSAKEQLPTFQMQSTGGATRVLGINPVTGKAEVAQGSEAKLTATPGEIMSAETQRRGQNISAETTRRGQDLTNARELERIANEKGKNSPEYIATKSKMEAQGKAEAKFEASAPAAISKADEAVRKIDELIGDTSVTKEGKVKYGKKEPHPGFNVSVGASAQPGFQYIPGTDKADFYARIEELQGGAFLEAYETLKGGGAITEIEGKKATQAITRMSTAQSEPEFIKAAREFQNVIKTGAEKAKAKLGKGGASGVSSAGGADVDTTNPLLK